MDMSATSKEVWSIVRKILGGDIMMSRIVESVNRLAEDKRFLKALSGTCWKNGQANSNGMKFERFIWMVDNNGDFLKLYLKETEEVEDFEEYDSSKKIKSKDILEEMFIKIHEQLLNNDSFNGWKIFSKVGCIHINDEEKYFFAKNDQGEVFKLSLVRSNTLY